MKQKKIIGNILTSLIVILCISVILIGTVPRIIGYTGFYVSSDSMEPAIKKGSIVYVKKISFDEIKEGDVLTFRQKDSSKWFTHRVILKNNSGESLYTKGDHNNIKDPLPTPYKYVVGKVYFTLPVLGYFTMALDSFWAKIVLVSAAVFYIAVEIEIYKTKKGRNTK